MSQPDHAARIGIPVSDPEPPKITKKDIWAQFNTDIRGKEVQTAETYSHSWIANQFGHVCLGMILGGGLGVLLGNGLSIFLPWLRVPFAWHVPFPWDNIAGSLVAIIGIAWWEWKSYRDSVGVATGQFPLGRTLLRDNALVAAGYMIVGVAIAFIYRFFAFTRSEWLGVPNLVWGLLCFLGLVVIGIVLSVPWLRQKIVWQKAGLPYLFRLAEAQPTMEDDDANRIQGLINRNPPPETAPFQIVIAGPIGSGRTQLCAGIGTELAFRYMTVRYLTLATLLEFATQSKKNPRFFDDLGPANITYWSWSKAQVVIIDDIGPLLTATTRSYDERVRYFRQVLDEQLMAVREVLARCHTVWVLGDPRADGPIAKDDHALDPFIRGIHDFCRHAGNASPDVLVAELEELEQGAAEQILKVPRARTRYVKF